MSNEIQKSSEERAVILRAFDILTPEFFIAALANGEGPDQAKDETLGSWIVNTFRDVARATSEKS